MREDVLKIFTKDTIDMCKSDNEKYFLWKIQQGWNKKNIPTTKEYIDRVNYEVGIICKMGFVDYMLMINDILEFANNNNIPRGCGRGSVGGCLIAYAMDISRIDPIKYHLYFERFLNPARVSLPDVDVDLGTTRRHEVFEYLQRRYGYEMVASIMTKGQMKSRSIIRNVGSSLGMPTGPGSEIDKIAKLFPNMEADFDESVAESEELQKYAIKYPDLFDKARRLAGKPKSVGVHAAGTLVAPCKIEELMPMGRGTGGKTSVVQWDMHDVEDAGLVKLDLLGLNTLDVMDRTLKLIEQRYGKKIDIESIPMDDKLAISIFRNGKTNGLFQLERKYVQELCKRMNITRFEEVCALNALIRPGTLHSGMTNEYIERKIGEKENTPLADCLSNTLKDTYNIMVYQEDLMRVVVDYAGFTMAEADSLRKGVSKKVAEKIHECRELFLKKSKEKGRNMDEAKSIFDKIEKFAQYGFNKSVSKDTKVYIIDKGAVNICDCKIGDMVYCYDDSNIVASEILNVYDHGFLNCYLVTFDDGSQVKCSMNHKFETKIGKLPLYSIIDKHIGVISYGEEKRIHMPWMSYKDNGEERIGASQEGVQGTSRKCYNVENEQFKTSKPSNNKRTEDSTCEEIFSSIVEESRDSNEEVGNDVKTKQDRFIQDEIVRDSEENIFEGRYNKGKVGKFKEMEAEEPGEDERDNIYGSKGEKRFKNGELYGECSIENIHEKEYENIVFGNPETSGFCQRFFMDRDRRMLALWGGVYKEAILVRKSSSEGYTINIRGGEEGEYCLDKDRDGLLSWCKKEYAITRMGRSDNENNIRQKTRNIFTRKIVSVEHLGEEHMFDLEIRNKSHNFFLANGIVTSNSHAVSYGKITYQSAWLKSHYFLEFMTELLNGEANSGEPKLDSYLRECRLNGVTILPPDARKANTFFKIESGKSIRFGLGFIKGVTESAVKALQEGISYMGTFTDLLMNDKGFLKKNIMENLILVGAFDFMGGNRARIVERYSLVKDMVEKYKTQQKRKKDGVNIRKEYTREDILNAEMNMEYFSKEYSLEEYIAFEHELCKCYIVNDPLTPFENMIESEEYRDIMDIEDKRFNPNKPIKLIAVLRSMNPHVITKGNSEGREMCFFDVFDTFREITCIAFPDVYDKIKEHMFENAVYTFIGKYDGESIILNNAELMLKM